jgi:large subunit ribosomal protein L40e
MHILVKTEENTISLEVERDTCVGELMGQLMAEGLMSENQFLVFSSQKARQDYTLEQLGITDESVIDLNQAVSGGAKDKKLFEPACQILAHTKFIKKKICRYCYATNSMKAKKCRKRKCGHWPDLRIKKILKEKSGK